MLGAGFVCDHITWIGLANSRNEHSLIIIVIYAILSNAIAAAGTALFGSGSSE